MSNLAECYAADGQYKQSIPLLEILCSKRITKLGQDHPDSVKCMNDLAEALCQDGQGSKAAKLYSGYFSAYRKSVRPNDPEYAGELVVAELRLVEAAQYELAESLLREGLIIREIVAPDLWNTFSAKTVLGRSLIGQKKYAEAEPLLLKGYEGMKAREKTIPTQARDRLPDAVEALIVLSRATDKPEEVKKWQTERSKYPAEASPPPRAKK